MVLLIDFIDHLEVEVLIIIELVEGVLLDDTLHEVPYIFLDILDNEWITLTCILMA